MRGLMIYTGSPNIIGVIKSRRMRRAGHVAYMRERRGAYRVFVVKPEGMSWLFPGLNGRILLKWLLLKWDVWHG
jgi:hypothetical protein